MKQSEKIIFIIDKSLEDRLDNANWDGFLNVISDILIEE